MNLITLRDHIWDYPEHLLVGKKSYLGRFTDFYNRVRPLSHIMTTVIVVSLLAVVLLTQIQVVLGFSSDTFVEGVVTGTDTTGQPVGPNKLNPIQVDSTQLDKDIIELIYEPLIRVRQDGKIEPVLAESYTVEGEGQERAYRFSLRKNVLWHDGKPLTTQDVFTTFYLLKDLAESNATNIFGTRIAERADIEILDDYVFMFTVGDEIIPNFEELISFKILPAHRIDQFKDVLVNSEFKDEELVSIGTGPYLLNSVTSSEVKLTANDNYYSGAPKIKNFVFKLLRDDQEAVQAIRSGQVHGISNITNSLLEQVGNIPNMDVEYSEPIYTQYWGIYFNLSDDGPKPLKDKEVRKAFAQGIDIELAIKTVFNQSQVATGPIAVNSPFHAAESQQPKYNLAQARKTLDDAGWKVVQTEVDGVTVDVREKDGQRLKFELSYVNNPDREELVSIIRADLASIGIIVDGQQLPPNSLRISRQSRSFELILQGVSTFSDPDRYEFFHSSQINETDNAGLNISSYRSSRTTSVIDEEQKKTVRVPLADKLLDDGRRTTNFDERKKNYDELQGLIAEDVPLIFLYHPSIRYYVNKRVQNIDMSDVTSIEQRLANVENWQIVYK